MMDYAHHGTDIYVIVSGTAMMFPLPLCKRHVFHQNSYTEPAE